MICRLPRLPAGNLFISEAITSWFLKRLICHSRKRVTIFSAFFVKSTGWKCSQESLRCCARIVFYDKVDLTLGADAGLSPPLRMRNRTFYGISLGWPHPNLQCLLGLKKTTGVVALICFFMFFQEWPNCMGKSWNIISMLKNLGVMLNLTFVNPWKIQETLHQVTIFTQIIVTSEACSMLLNQCVFHANRP